MFLVDNNRKKTDEIGQNLTLGAGPTSMAWEDRDSASKGAYLFHSYQFGQMRLTPRRVPSTRTITNPPIVSFTYKNRPPPTWLTLVRYSPFAMDPNTRCLSPPPRLPSPQLLPTPLPSPPLHHQQLRPRLNNASSQSKPPSPLGRPASSGSPILPLRNLHAPRAQALPPLDLSLWLDGDDFGARRARSTSPLSPSSPIPEKPAQRDHGHGPTPISTAYPRSRTRPRSPPPSPGRPGTPPPVPPIPTHFLGASPRTPVLQPRSTNHRTHTGRIPDFPSPQSHLLRKSRSSDAMSCILLTVLDGP